ncbi:hypothetical protein Xen7305DRAFT_00042370 [Xenococcus sp. PCC 7305]|uniref:SPOR domain-containing protein n=1 Tax=Xenococcus sp. PCC 7305 TaxID=102125 RepID=UPI0002AD0FFE|nr:hypothetical protein [Xenococcus sp. PCC 7305]ELS04503.1 hypothetical protein Xen7305DRAFT_00042370 [Xenococcus sp. PCC 7305]
MTSNSNQPQEKYGVYRMTGKTSGGLVYRLVEGPYTERKTAIRKADELNASEPESYFGYVVSEYQGESWSPERPSSFMMEKDNGE